LNVKFSRRLGVEIMLLEIRNLWVKVDDKIILRDINLTIDENEVHVLMGPNAVGKSTLLMTIMGIPKYKVIRGRIIFKGTDITNLRPHERAQMGIGLAFQIPPKVDVRLSYLIDRLAEKHGFIKSKLNSVVSEFGISHLMNRYLYSGFSGGEMKRTELLITFLQRPSLVLLDEPDSGIDIESLSYVGRIINRFIDEGSAVLLVTHLGTILEYLKKIDKLHIMLDGTISYSGPPGKMIDLIKSVGYTGLKKIIGGDVHE